MPAPLRLSRRCLAPLAASGLLASVPAFAQAAWKPGRNVEIVVGTNPGSGFDRTARVLQEVWKQAAVIEAPVTVLNKPGGAGVIAYHFVNQRARFADELTIIAPLLLTNYLTHTSSFEPHGLTPLCVLLGEEIVVATGIESRLRTGKDFAAALKADPSSVSIAMSGVGGQNHITVGLVGQAAGADLSKLKVVGFDGSGEAVTAVVGGHVDVIVGPASSVGGMLEAGRLRGLGIASTKRLDGVLAAVPTWQEQGIPVVFSNWRGIAGPKPMPSAQRQYWDETFRRTVQLPLWQQELVRGKLSDHYLDSKETERFIDSELARFRPVLNNLGLA